ncbi:MAG: TIGR03545 family protein, partial [Desulfobacteraceae bacterium]|nr:TIGR03545 family protein [Desulfobacteraceae bacterium]
TKAVGGKVELASVDISILPAGVGLFGLQVTNPKKPMENSVEINHIQAVMEILPLLQRKVIINDILFDKVQFNSKRGKSGALGKPKASQIENEADKPEWLKSLCQQNEINLFDMPDVKRILKDEYKSLKSVKLSEDLQKSLSQAEKDFKQKLDNLSDKQKIESYKTRINKIREKESSSFALLGSALELQEIYKEIEDDLEDISDIKKDYKVELKKYKKELGKISSTLSQDVEHLTNKYSPLKDGKIDFSKLLFGQSLCSQIQKYSKWFAIIEPYFDPTKKKDGKQGSKKPAKTGKEVYFLAQNIKINLLFGQGVLTGKASNITNMPAVTGLPATINFFGGGFQGLKSFDFKGIMDLVDPARPHHKANLDVSGFLLENFIFSDKPDLSLAMIKSVTSITSSFKLDGNKISCLFGAKFKEVVMQATSSKGSSLQEALVKTLTDIDKFNLLFDINGTDDKYDVAIKSDLDNVFNSLAQKMVKSSMGNFKKDLKTGVMEKTSKSTKQNNNSLADFSKIGGLLSERSAQSSALLNELY